VQAVGLFYDIATAKVLRINADGLEDLEAEFDAGLQGRALADR